MSRRKLKPATTPNLYPSPNPNPNQVLQLHGGIHRYLEAFPDGGEALVRGRARIRGRGRVWAGPGLAVGFFRGNLTLTPT